MLTRALFRKPKNDLEYKHSGVGNEGPLIPEDVCINCSECKETLLLEELESNGYVCPNCNYHFKLSARLRAAMIADEGTFEEMFQGLKSSNIIEFPGYDEKLKEAGKKTNENEAVICGKAEVGGFPVCLFVMNGDFMMGSMGTVVGEKITRTFEYAALMELPVIGYTVSGGARMQEGILSLMQMAKTSGAVKRHSDKGLLYITVLTNPTTGGVTASFAMEGDIILAEPGALIGFAGPRVIEQTIRQKLPKGFQRAEFLLEKGFVDAIVSRNNQKRYLSKLLALHSRRELI